MSDDRMLRQYNAETAFVLIGDLIEVYLDAHAADGAFYNEDRYRRQIAGHMNVPGWTLVTAQVDGRLVGYAYGFPLPEKTRWWEGIQGSIPPGFTNEDGHRTFALSELLVRPDRQRQGIARALHDELIGSRPEPRMTLLTRPDNAPAQSAYMSWGWQRITQLRPAWEDAPIFDVFVRDAPMTGGPMPS
ncbi:GNAT family N-acetyltransferase [Micromonospora craterilacus]|uniref:GNAT family N-acetyltransferase n=1 Tax=Micromonospora craterilacus TaxID=1655439 RepID=A0A2W2EX74_9ACTN|nr:GNAT family N-acetyltransferase [Micromonospora craterilacus]PZG21459.1 GNAT family N-acetyltransferase [Micromonospora craterilacus]